MPIEFLPLPTHAILRVRGELLQDTALDLCAAIHQASTYWHYDRLVLEINSPGGELLALRALVHEMNWWRGQRGRVETAGQMQAGSAAALLLSLGDVGRRVVCPHTELVFHHTRVMTQGAQALTAQHAGAAARRLEQADVTLLRQLTEHIVQGHGDIATMARTGLARCQQLQSKAAQISAALGADAGFGSTPAKSASLLLRQLTRTFEKTLKLDDARPYTELLASIFARDSRMPVDVAWGLLLVDSVHGVQELQPGVRPVTAQAPRMAA
jgi:ATP-dependent protease ClpP protease subunit